MFHPKGGVSLSLKREDNMSIRTCVFDAYGTIFDVNSAARRAAERPEQSALARVWPRLAADWRMKQLQYTWLRAITGHHTDFWQVTKDGLDWAMEAQGLEDPILRETLLALYWELEAFPEVPQLLSDLKEQGMTCAILSNGSPDMLEGAVEFAGIEGLLDAVISVEPVGIFKPSSKVYDLVPERLGCAANEVLFVSSNGWDIAGASAYGFRTVWVNRVGEPMDRLFANPHHVLSDLTTLAELI